MKLERNFSTVYFEDLNFSPYKCVFFVDKTNRKQGIQKCYSSYKIKNLYKLQGICRYNNGTRDGISAFVLCDYVQVPSKNWLMKPRRYASLLTYKNNVFFGQQNERWRKTVEPNLLKF
jgi:hypothetical protein